MPTGNEYILVVDDELPIVQVMARSIEGLGYRVKTTTSSLEALELFKANPMEYDLVISDLTMPELSGKHLCKELLQIRSDIPIIMCTGNNSSIDAAAAEELGVRGFLLKPVTRQELAEEIRESIDGSGPSPGTVEPEKQ